MRRWAHRAGMAIICQYPRTLLFSFLLVAVEMVWSQTPAPVWRGVLQDDNTQHIAQARVKLDAGSEHKETSTDPHGVFLFDFLVPKTYHVSVDVNGWVYRSSADIKIPAQAAPVTPYAPSRWWISRCCSTGEGTRGWRTIDQQGCQRNPPQ
jgi:hypothetical protein